MYLKHSSLCILVAYELPFIPMFITFYQGSKKRNETNVSNLQFIKTYLSYLRQTLMIDRNLEMIENMKTKLPLIIGQSKQTSIKGKITKPEDLIRQVLLTEIIIEPRFFIDLFLGMKPTNPWIK